MAATCAGLEGAQERPSCKQGQLPLMPVLGPLIEKYGAHEHQGQMLLGERFYESLRHEPRQDIHMEKPLHPGQVAQLLRVSS